MGIFSKKIKFISAVCPECQGHLVLDSSLERAFCQYCGAQCIIESAPKKAKKQSKLEILLDFVERQQALRRTERQELQKRREEEERKHNEQLKRYWWIYALVMAGIILFGIIMSNL